VWDYNFDNISSRVLLEQLLDSHIQRETIITQKILDSDEAKEIIGADNIEIIKNAIIDKLNEDYYTTPVDNAVNKDIGKFFLGLNKRYVQVLLGSANQFLKQYVGVITDAMFQVGLNNWSKAVVVSVKKAETTKRLLDRFPIGERLRETPAFSYDISDKELERSTIDVRNPLTKLVSKTLEAEGNLNKSWGEGIMYSLKWADNRAAVHTWLAAYGKYIIDEKNKKQQVRYSAIPFKFEDIDWEAEASNSNQDAANYAEQVVSRTQYISDPSLGAKALKSRNIGDVIIKSMLFPLATFTINNKNRIITDIANVRTDKGAKGRIAGYIAGIAMYNAGLLGLKEMGEAAAESIAESLGFSGDKDDEDDSKKFEKWWKDVVMEMTFGGIEIPEVTLKYMINTAASFYKAEEIERAEADLINAQREDEKERLIDEYSETITPEEEEKGITPEDKYKNHIADLKKHVGDKKEPIYDFYTRNIGRGNTTLISEIAEKILKKINKVDDIDDTDLTVSEQNKYSNAFITLSVLEGLSVVGWSEGTINSLAKKIEKNVKESLKKDIKTAKENKERKRIEEDEQQ
jgi:spore coat protein CotF